MHLTVVTVVLLVGILNAVTAHPHIDETEASCKAIEDVPCGGGWSRIDADFCVKFFQTPKSFNDARKRCISLGGELVPMKTPEQSWKGTCITIRANPGRQSVRIGLQRSGEGFTHADGSGVTNAHWHPGQPDNFGGHENCVRHKQKGSNDKNCADKNAFMCSKKM